MLFRVLKSREILSWRFLASIGMTAFFLVFLAILFGFANDSLAASDPSECVITIKSVQLKKESGEWITVIEPDHQVDLTSQEPTVSLFNNGRRVPPGSYNNFKILLLRTIKLKDAKHLSLIYEAPHDEITIYASKDLPAPLQVKARSFIRVWFGLDLAGTMDDSDSGAYFSPPKKVKEAAIIVDDRKITISGEDIQLVF